MQSNKIKLNKILFKKKTFKGTSHMTVGTMGIKISRMWINKIISTLAWRIPCTEEPGELQSMGLQSWN